MRADRNDGGANRAGAARTFEAAVVACDRLTRTVVVGSVKRVAEEAVEWGDPIPEHAQHLRVLVRCAGLEPSRYRKCYAREGDTGVKRGFCARGHIRVVAFSARIGLLRTYIRREEHAWMKAPMLWAPKPSRL